MTWDELKRLDGANTFSMGDMAGRLKAPCPAARLHENPQTLSSEIIDALGRLEPPRD